MSRSNSPFFREHVQKTELSPLLSDEQNRQPRFDVSLGKGKPRMTKPSRTSMPLVYTDFRSPEASRVNLGDANMSSRVNDVNDVNGNATDESRTPVDSLDHDAITRHSFVTNLENIGSKSVWMILFMPILLGVAVYFATVPWRYSGWTSEFTAGTVPFMSPPAAVQAGFMRSFVSIPGYYCVHPECSADRLNIQAHLVSSEASEENKKAINLLHTHVGLADYVSQFYSPFMNGSISTNKTVVVPLPILRMDSPVFGLQPDQQKMTVTSTLSTKTTDNDDTKSTEDSNDSTNDSTNDTYSIDSERKLRDSYTTPTTTILYTSSLPTGDYTIPTLTTVTTSRTYMLTVAILQIVLSLLTFIYLLYLVRHVYTNARRLREKFADVHKPIASSYGSINNDYNKYSYTDIAEEDAVVTDADEAPTMWHFILPEQYSAMALLFFLCAWQGLIPSICTILQDFGVSVSEGMLFSAGLTTSIAQFGLVFTLIIYIDGLKYNSKDGRYKPNRTSNTYSVRSYDPFSLPNDNDSIRSNAYDTNSKEYWRRSSTGLANTRRSNNLSSVLTPLQREYKNAIQLYVTYHHPRSTDFVGFVHKKLIMLFLTWVIIVLYWLLYYPRLWHHSAFTQIQNDNLLLRFAIAKYVILAVSLVWVYWIVQVSVSTGLRLRLLKLNASRFRQVAFRTLFFQLQLGLLVLLCTVGWYASTHNFFTSTTFSSTLSYWHYLFLWANHYGLLHILVLATPPLSVHSAESLVFVTALIYSIAYCMQPPLEDPNTSKFKIQEFVGLERNLPDNHAHTQSVKNVKAALKKNKLQSKLRQYLVEEDYKKFMKAYLPSVLNQHNKQYFCIESALIYLEISYQTYFPVDSVLNSITDNNKATTNIHSITNKEQKTDTTTTTLVPNTTTIEKSSAFTVLPSPGTFGRQVSNNSFLSLSSNSILSNSDGTSSNNSPMHRASVTKPSSGAKVKKNPFEDTESVNPFEAELPAGTEDVEGSNPFEEGTTISPGAQLPPISVQKEDTLSSQTGSLQQPPSCTSATTNSSNPFETDAVSSEDEEEETLQEITVPNAKTNLTNPFDDEWSAPAVPPQVPQRPKLSNTNTNTSTNVTFSVPIAPSAKATKNATNPFADADTDNTNNQPIAEPSPPTLPSGPKLNLSGVGYTLKSTFSCDKYTTFGFLAECEADQKLVVSFRGSVLGNAVSNLKIAQVTLPNLKHPRAYFTHLIRAYNARDAHNRSQESVFSQLQQHSSYQTNGYSPHIAKLRADSSDSEDSQVELIKDAKELSFTYEHTPSADEQNDYLHLLNRMENGDIYDEEYENENNFTPPETTSTSEKINNSQLAQDIKSVGKSIPLLNQGFKRVHAGFWNSYSSIREDFLQAVVIAMYQHRQQTIRQLQQQSGVSPTQSWYVPRTGNDMNSPITTPLGGNHSAGVNGTPQKENDTISGIKALFTSPLGKNNPFSPLFSPINHNNNINNTHSNPEQASTIDSLYPTTYGASTKATNPNNKNNNKSSTQDTDTITPLSITFCGHSLGAAIASLAAFELAENLPLILEAFALEECFNTPKTHAVQQLPSVLACPAPALSLYMYGSPRVGNSLFSSAMSKKIDNIYRMQVNGDLVCMMPKFVGFYRHIGTAVLLDEGESGNIIIQPSIIESSILQHYTGNVHNHSLDKYRACLEACLEPTELTEYLTNEFQNLSTFNNNTFVGESTISSSTAGGNTVVVNKRKSINVDDIPEWLIASNNV